ncbi:hypothetical protein E6O75_ATG06262 [Venturia nashicola]|uniref:Uncharacterized protein n=1 Tax=Venturia nashicola TaxID=86259 RepID=A0A4Z1PC29_9PEZI|nr:hypothetical protein E6O75_ATG06262 [Venturia nashicola]
MCLLVMFHKPPVDILPSAAEQQTHLVGLFHHVCKQLASGVLDARGELGALACFDTPTHPASSHAPDFFEKFTQNGPGLGIGQ